MSTPTRTPGPWVLFPFTESFNNADGHRTGWHVNQHGGAGFVTTLYERSHRAIEDAANARLIAAAPELLQFAKNVRDSLATGAPLHVEACAAIAKATGEGE